MANHIRQITNAVGRDIGKTQSAQPVADETNARNYRVDEPKQISYERQDNCDKRHAEHKGKRKCEKRNNNYIRNNAYNRNIVEEKHCRAQYANLRGHTH